MSLNKTIISVSTVIDTSVEKVWGYWTEPEHIVQWNNASDDWHTPKAVNDLREGGSFLSRMEAKDGSFGFDFSGSYTKVTKNKAIEYVMEDGRKVAVHFKSNGTTTEIIETFEAETTNGLDVQQQGWQAILNHFKKYVEATPF